MRKFLLIVSALAFLGTAVFPANTVKADDKAWSVDGEVNVLSAYYYRGIKTQDEGLILQPELTFSYLNFKAGDLKVVPYAQVWGNITDQSGDRWDEVDINGGLQFQFDRLELTAQYSYQTSPDNAFDDIHEVSLVLGYDDSGVNHLPFALNPHVGIYQELNQNNNTYLEFGVAPEFKIGECPVAFTLPITVGTSINDTYGDDFVGYASVGLDARYNINDHWYVHAGVEYLQLLADSAKTANGGDDNEVIGTVGVGFSF